MDGDRLVAGIAHSENVRVCVFPLDENKQKMTGFLSGPALFANGSGTRRTDLRLVLRRPLYHYFTAVS